MKIGIIGAGRIGGALGKGWTNVGHEVVFGVRHPDDSELKQLVESLGARASIASPRETAAASEVVTFAIPGAAMQAAIADIGDLGGKIVIDTTNGLGSPTQSGAQIVAGWATGARVFKAFNSVGFEILTAPTFGEVQADMLFCGDDAGARAVVAQLISELGLKPVYVGNLSTASLVESMARLWMTLARGGMGRRLAFKLLTANDDAK